MKMKDSRSYTKQGLALKSIVGKQSSLPDGTRLTLGLQGLEEYNPR